MFNLARKQLQSVKMQDFTEKYFKNKLHHNINNH
jgi:hypothetical protein